MSGVESMLEGKNIFKDFESGGRKISVLQGASISLTPGDIISVRGESGSGKSTLLNILAGLEYPEDGMVSWNGENISSLKGGRLYRERARFIGMIFQAYYLIPELNVLENVLFAKRILGAVERSDKERAHSLLDRVGLADRLKSNTTLLSGGERQRVAVARALMNRPQLILADEPTGNLDEKTGKEVIDLLFEVCREENNALLIVTHNRSFADLATKQLILEQGTLLEPNSNES